MAEMNTSAPKSSSYGSKYSNSASKGSYSAAKSSGFAKKAAPAAGARKELAPTTHIMVTKKQEGEERGQLVGQAFITENEHGLYLNIREAIEPGQYYINKKKSAQ